MAEIIAKIIHRIGSDSNLPQLEAGELGFSTDERKLYIGNDPTLFPIGANVTTTQTEILTEFSQIDVSQISGLTSTPVIITQPATDGQVIVYSSAIDGVTNRGGAKPGTVDLGNIENIKISGGYYNYTLETDGLGNLSWNSKGTITANIKNVSNSSPAVLTLSNTTPITNRAIVTIAGVSGMNAGLINGKHFFVKVSEDFPTSGNVLLYTDTDLTIPFSAPTLVATANTGRSVHTSYNKVVTGSNRFVQFNDSGIMGSDAGFTYDKVTNTLSSELLTSTFTIQANSQPNITSVGTLVSLNVSGNVDVAGNVEIDSNLTVSNTANIANLNVAKLNAVDAFISGNLVVQGNTVNTNVEELTIQDPIITLGGAENGADLVADDEKDRGLILQRFDTSNKKSFIGWDASEASFVLASEVTITDEKVSVNQFGPLKIGVLSTDGNANIQGSINVVGTGNFAGNVSMTNNLSLAGNANIAGSVVVGTTVKAEVFESTVTSGGAPFIVKSNVMVANLRAETANYSNTSTNLIGGNTRTLVVQTGPNVTGFINAPVLANSSLVWTGTDFAWQVPDSGNITGGDANQILFQTGPNVTGFINAPTTINTVLKWNGSSFTWGVGGATIENDVVTDSKKYPLFANSTSGSAETIYTSNEKYLYKPSTGELEVPAPIATNGIQLNRDKLETNYTIKAGTNGLTVGPFTLAPGFNLTLAAGQRHVII